MAGTNGMLRASVQDQGRKLRLSPRYLETATRYWWVGLCALAVFACVPLLLILTNGIKVPVVDEYEFVWVIETIRSGHASFATFWAPHNEHRILFPRLVLSLLIFLTRWNSVAIMIASWAVMAGAGLFLLHCLTRIFDEFRPRLWIVAVALSLSLFYSAIQKENWLWAFQLTFFLVQFGVILGTFWMSFTRISIFKRLPAAVLFGVLATFSAAQGLLMWPALIITLLLSDETKRGKLVGTLVLLLLTAGVVGAYFHDYQTPSAGHFNASEILSKPKLLVHFFVELLGAPLTFGLSDDLRVKPKAAFIAGCVLLFLFFLLSYLVIRSNQRSKAAPWIGLGFFVLGFCAMATYGRLVSGIYRLPTWSAAYTSRFTTHEVLFTISVLALGYLSLGGRKRPITRAEWSMAGLLPGALGVLVLLGDVQAFRTAPAEQRPRLLSAKLLPFLPYFDPGTDGSPAGPFFALTAVPGCRIFDAYLKPYCNLGHVHAVKHARFGGLSAELKGNCSVANASVDVFHDVRATGLVKAGSTVSPTLVFLKPEGQDKFLAATELHSESLGTGSYVYDWQTILPAQAVANGTRLQQWVFDKGSNTFLEVGQNAEGQK
ncbi:MAG TPA: hypothetical protein VGD78_00265 [Chthoniobacterales bacterium]